MLDPKAQTFEARVLNRPPSTLPPALLDATQAGNSVPPNEFTKQEDLGIQEMEGVQVHGVREIQRIPADQSGTGKEVTLTDEYWYSDHLRINLLIKHTDPRAGSTTMKVVNVSLSEPDHSLFEIPASYRPEGESHRQ